MAERERRVSDRQVLLIGALIVIGVIAVRLAGELVPGFDAALGFAPLVIVALVVVTLYVLVQAVRPPRG